MKDGDCFNLRCKFRNDRVYVNNEQAVLSVVEGTPCLPWPSFGLVA